MTSDRRPLVTLLLYAYQERRFIEAAVSSLLGQDYSPLEIVLSDDGSTDGTYEVMERLAGSYSGPHRVLLNRNATNTGIGSQINAGVAMSDGELIVLANGDDVSEPNRVSRTVQAWIDNGRVAAVWTDLTQIDGDVFPRGRIMSTAGAFPDLATGIRNRFEGAGLAACVALRRDVFTRFGPLPDNLMLEDNPLFLRAVLLGAVLRLGEPLVRYRVHEHNISQSYLPGDFEEWRARHRKATIWQTSEGVKANLQMLRDLYQAPVEQWPDFELRRARLVAMELVQEKAILYDYYARDTSIPLRARCASLMRLAVTLAKVGIKRAFPFIEARNDRWHYRRANEDAGNRHDT